MLYLKAIQTPENKAAADHVIKPGEAITRWRATKGLKTCLALCYCPQSCKWRLKPYFVFKGTNSLESISPLASSFPLVNLWMSVCVSENAILTCAHPHTHKMYLKWKYGQHLGSGASNSSSVGSLCLWVYAVSFHSKELIYALVRKLTDSLTGQFLNLST